MPRSALGERSRDVGGDVVRHPWGKERGASMAASLATVAGGTVGFSDEQIAELGMQFRGPICGPGDRGDQERGRDDDSQQ